VSLAEDAQLAENERNLMISACARELEGARSKIVAENVALNEAKNAEYLKKRQEIIKAAVALAVALNASGLTLHSPFFFASGDTYFFLRRLASELEHRATHENFSGVSVDLSWPGVKDLHNPTPTPRPNAGNGERSSLNAEFLALDCRVLVDARVAEIESTLVPEVPLPAA
jgi:hypothetical protein